MRRIITLGSTIVILLIAFSVAAAGYVVVLKNGERIRCKEPMRIQGKQAILTLSTGTLASYPLQYVDVVETERYNKLGLGDALMIEELNVEAKSVPTPTPRRSLGTVASIDSGISGTEAPDEDELLPTPTPGIKLRDVAYRDERVTDAFTKIFTDRDLFIYRTSTGTRPEFLFVQTITDSQAEVFKALEIVAEAYAVVNKLDATRAPEAVELEMLETSGRAAGTFRLTTGLAEQLVTGKVPIEQFYVENVIF